MTTDDKRKDSRIDTENLLAYVCLDEKDRETGQGMGKTLNVSEGGILMETHIPVDPQYFVSLTISMEEDIMEMKGKVAFCKERADGSFETGIHFIEADSGQLQFLRQYMEIFKKETRNE